MIRVKNILRLFEEAYQAWQQDGAVQLSAAISFYTALSLAPLLLFVVVFAGLIFGEEAAAGEIVTQTQAVIGADEAATIQSIIQQASRPRGGIVATVIAFVTVLLGASSIFWHIKRALNRVWGIKPNPESRLQGFVGIIQGRVLAFGMVLGAGALLLTLMGMDTALSGVRRLISSLAPELSQALRLVYIAQVSKFSIGFILITFSIAMIYKILPDAVIAWQDVSIGAATTSLLLSLGNLGASWYLSHWSTRSAYGAAGSLLALLVWVYFSALVFFFGAEFTKVYANTYGSRIMPYQDAVLIVRNHQTREELIQQRNEESPGEDQAEPEPPAVPELDPPAELPMPQPEEPAAQRSSWPRRYGGVVAIVSAVTIGFIIGVKRLASNDIGQNEDRGPAELLT